uniref:Uncharacterized protein n=1 Tax=Candidatus Kentrum sp. LFY TaxID=2126342 RepID=A0A450WGX8_9GAMM|nr:MAG: hypothetical protein BECKLFY1418C_GA0070996_102243 [Candidatus Kentron sp. LFY]
MAILTNASRRFIAEVIKSQTLYFAWGIGDPAWDTTPVPPPLDAVALEHEVGRRLITQVLFVEEDDEGEFVTPTGRYTASATPTRHLLVIVQFDFGDAPASEIREVGVFAQAVTDPELPEGQRYFVPCEVVDPGILISVERRTERLIRSPTSRENFQFIVSP